MRDNVEKVRSIVKRQIRIATVALQATIASTKRHAWLHRMCLASATLFDITIAGVLFFLLRAAFEGLVISYKGFILTVFLNDGRRRRPTARAR